MNACTNESQNLRHVVATKITDNKMVCLKTMVLMTAEKYPEAMVASTLNQKHPTDVLTIIPCSTKAPLTTDRNLSMKSGSSTRHSDLIVYDGALSWRNTWQCFLLRCRNFFRENLRANFFMTSRAKRKKERLAVCRKVGVLLTRLIVGQEPGYERQAVEKRHHGSICHRFGSCRGNT